MPTTPAASAARNGFPGDPDAVNASAQVNQFLGTHGITPVYGGNQIYNPVMAESSLQNTLFWLPTHYLEGSDLAQAFTMPSGQTAVGRIKIPLLPTGDGCDVQITLCPDNGSGAPNLASPLASTVVPAAWITNVAAADGLTDPEKPPLATSRHNTMLIGLAAFPPWNAPAVGPNGAGDWATPVTSGNYCILMGGVVSAGVVAPNVATLLYEGGGVLSNPAPQPSLPQGAYFAQGAATSDSIAFLGGVAGDGRTVLTAVWSASWDPNTGMVGAWSAQAPLPAPVMQGAAVTWNDTAIYVIAGTNDPGGSGFVALDSVYYAAISGGQINQWLTGPPLPVAVQGIFVGVVGDWVVVAGGQTSSSVTVDSVWYSAIDPDGSLEGWRSAPPLPIAVSNISAQYSCATTDSAFVILGGVTSGNTTTYSVQTITFDEGGPGAWETQLSTGGAFPVSAFPSSAPGAWDLVGLSPGTNYNVTSLLPAPMISVPLPASGLTAGAAYYVVLHRIGGDLNNYVQVGVVSASNQQSLNRPRGSSGPWAALVSYPLMAHVYDQTPTGQPLHVWSDPNTANLAAAAATYVRDDAGRLLGECSATAKITQAGADPSFLPSVAVLAYPDDGGMPTGITQLA